jgi:[ribosomal protein S5]-alanine N-acetyltransferase
MSPDVIVAGAGPTGLMLAGELALGGADVVVLERDHARVRSDEAAQQALLRNGFRPYGVAPSYLKIDGRWQDFLLFHLLSDDE